MKEKEQERMKLLSRLKGMSGRKYVKYLNLMRTIYNKLCKECQNTMVTTVDKDVNKAVDTIGKLETLCAKCKDKIKPDIKKLEFYKW